MLSAITNILQQTAHLVFPHNCHACGTDVLSQSHMLCAKCLAFLPATKFELAAGNPIEKIFYGRLRIEQATAGFYFTKNATIQQLIFELKYRNNREIGVYLGELLGKQIKESSRFETVDALIPIPLNSKREFKRGYNQAMAICEGIAMAWNKPILKNAVVRNVFTQTQTKQDRIHRNANMENVFSVANSGALKHQHVLLVDDVVTTGATLESCGRAILQTEGSRLSIATLACTA